jgi:hypothetical protein
MWPRKLTNRRSTRSSSAQSALEGPTRNPWPLKRGRQNSQFNRDLRKTNLERVMKNSKMQFQLIIHNDKFKPLPTDGLEC